MSETAPSWQVPLLEILVETSISDGKVRYDEEYLLDLLHRLRVTDDSVPLKDRKGFARVDDYHHNPRLRFIRRLAPMLEDRVAKDPSLLMKQPPSPPETATSVHGTRLVFDPVRFVFEVLLDSDKYPVSGLKASINDFTQKKLAPAACELVRVCNLGDCRYDFEIVSNAGANSLWESLTAIPWCKEAFVKPDGQFGVRAV